MTVDYVALLFHSIMGNCPVASCYAFSVNKCGSTMMHGMIEDVCRRSAILAISIPNNLWNRGILYSEWENDPEVIPAFLPDRLYYGFRALPTILLEPSLDLHSKRFVLLVRDPRDALVSQYFSTGRVSGSHSMPQQNIEKFRAFRSRFPDNGIDDYVLRAAPELVQKLVRYRDGLNFGNGLLRLYEKVYYEKEAFLAEIFDHFGIIVPQAVIADVARAHDVRPEVEDQSKHIRKGTPGDHKEKLQPATITALNDIFRDIATFYGYIL